MKASNCSLSTAGGAVRPSTVMFGKSRGTSYLLFAEGHPFRRLVEPVADRGVGHRGDVFGVQPVGLLRRPGQPGAAARPACRERATEDVAAGEAMGSETYLFGPAIEIPP